MKHAEFINKISDDAIIAAIAAAEKRTTGEIRVFVSKRKWPDATMAAQKHFATLAMHKTRHRNAVLIFVAPASRTFAIWGDVGIHKHCGEEFWKSVRDEMEIHLKHARYTEALVRAVERTGELLARHFPCEPGGNPNEQSDTVVRD
jgi:uncharacterized membrane protein